MQPELDADNHRFLFGQEHFLPEKISVHQSKQRLSASNFQFRTEVNSKQ
jgi:hypothetical protein